MSLPDRRWIETANNFLNTTESLLLVEWLIDARKDSIEYYWMPYL